MANTIITNQYIARKFIALSRNTNAFLMNVNRQYDSDFERDGAKAGQSIRIRLPVDYTLRTGPTASAQNSAQTSVTLTVATQIGVDMNFTTVDRTMNIDRFTENFIAPAVNTVVGGLAGDVMSGSEGGASNWTANYDVNGNILSPTALTWLNAKATMENHSVPNSQYKVIMSPYTQATTVNALAGYFNSQPLIAKQYENGDMTRALGFDWMTDQTVLLHTTGTLASSGSTYTATKGWSFGTVSGANQTGSSLTVAALTGTLAKGDIIKIDGVFNVNPVTKTQTSSLRTFTVTAPCTVGATTIPIYPAITPASGGPVQFQTVGASPANSAVIYCVSQGSSQYRKNLAYVPPAPTVATVDLIMPPNVDGAREVFDETSIRVCTQWQGGTDVLLTRLDMLYGYAYLKPEWIVVVPDVV